MSWEGQIIVTASNPFPGHLRPIDGTQPDASGTYPMASDDGLGLNVYIAGGMGLSGSIPVVIVGSSGSGGGGVSPAVTSAGYEFTASQISTLFLASNPSRKSFTIYNDSTQTYLIRFAATVSTSSWSFSLYPQEFYETPYPGYTGDVAGMSYMSGSGIIHVEELS